jgi:hypothetical protein
MVPFFASDDHTHANLQNIKNNENKITKPSSHLKYENTFKTSFKN